MTNHGDDCYFFYYSTCTKGDGCPFRHCEAAMGNETVCSLWQEGRCFRTVCKFRHMEITKNRKEIPCYWENQLAGCQKPHCAFFHDKPRFIQGVFVPPDKSVNKNEEQQHEEPAPPPPAPLPTTANPQLRGVIKTETQEPVPSPTHPPVVINPADDDEDEDDQFSEEGEDGKGGPSPRKLAKSGDSLNFGVSTLEEIRLRRALKASMKRSGYPIQSAEPSANGEKENIQAFFRPAVLESRDGSLLFEETERPRGSVAERLGRKIPGSELSGDAVPLRRSLAQRLGRVVDVEQPSAPPQKALKPVKERLGLHSGPAAAAQPAESSAASKKVPEQIRIKTLEEIKQEKAVKSQPQSHKDAPQTPKTNSSKASKGSKRAIGVKDASIGHVKTFSEILRAKKKRQEEEEDPSLMKAKHTVEKVPDKIQGEADADGPGPEATEMEEVRVKTLEEIRREKTVRVQAGNKKSSGPEENGAKKPRLLHVIKPTPQPGSVTTEKSAEGTETPLKAAGPETSNSVKVKSFEEIMREKRLRKQEMEEKDRSSSEADPAADSLKRKLPAKVSFTSPGSSSPSSPSSTGPAPDSTLSTQRVPVRKLIPRRSKAAADPAVKPTESQSSSREVPDRNTRISAALSAAKQARAAPQSPAAEAPPTGCQKKSPEHAADTKVRPKLNVKPSVMKPAVQVKPSQKRRAAGRSAVAAVKPLNSAPAVQEEPLQETTCTDRQLLPDAQLSSAVPRSPSTLLDSGSSCSPPREDLQTVPVFKQGPGHDTKLPVSAAAASREASTVPQSPVLKTPTQSKPRRPSVAASRATSSSTSTSADASSSVVDDFEDLINEFTDDHLEDDVDPGIGEDDLLQELSEMIDS
ncbi:zinc finger CCCH domain-containing protein 11A isoform X1 [Brachyistius frenatus]|uniref:zinc finger CCCH domain-containing protein 11A isoform X1 n=1 Tax=Brachyistius frenatus TaxID=100188 RepID=UPI0037E9A0A2